MAFKTPVVDRIPTYPGRVKLTPVSGQTDTYDLIRADQPIEEGTPINKALFDQKAYCLTGDVIVYVSKSGNDMAGDGSSAAPYLTIQKAIDSLPKWLEGYTATLSISEGVYAERIEVEGFQGGVLVIGSPGRAVTVRGIYINASSVVRINVNITRTSAVGGTPLQVLNGSHVQIGTEITVDVASGNVSGIVVEGGSVLRVVSDLFGGFIKTTVNNSPYIAVYATEGSRVVLGEIAGSGNATGLHAASGAVITYGSRSMSATTMHVTAGGGRIYSGAQASIPNY
jgi:hypothetical protein